jgi:organic radical activating enzyme
MKNRYYLWGAGSVGQRALKYLKPMGVLDGIIDNDPDKRGQIINGLEIYNYELIKPILIESDTGVIIAYFGSEETEKRLAEDGVQYWKLSDFIPQWYWEKYRRHALGFLDFPITTRCTLNCRDCMQYIPDRVKQNEPLESLVKSLDALFGKVSFIGEISIIGGEPFLHEDLATLINHIYNHYHKKIGSLVITTNGMVLPDLYVLDVCRKTGVYINVSDYSETLPQIENIVKKFEVSVKNASVKINKRRWIWVNPGKFNTYNDVVECTQTHMQLFNKGLWRCTLMAAAASAGICEAREGYDYIDLSLDCSESFKKFLQTDITAQRTSQCKKCLYHKSIAIPAAVQI